MSANKSNILMNLKVNEGGKVDKKVGRRIFIEIFERNCGNLEGFEGF